MRREMRLTAIALTTFGLGSAAATSTPETFSTETLAALDPTRAGRIACRGSYLDGSSLDTRLALAASLSAQQGLGTQPIGLYPGISASDLPLGEIDPQARRYFDQGLALAYGFNHAAAIRSFQQARQIDPGCAMCWWGEALANGPNINASMDSEQNRAALAALEMAERLSADADAEVSALVAAQAARYSADPEADRGAMDRAYAEAMLGIARRNPDSDDLAILAAESAMNTTAWDYWDLETEEPRPYIAEAVSLLERVMARNPTHPQASHLYIHLMELPDPERAEAAADRLRETGPAQLGHLVHMPAHIYYRLGRYADSMEANLDAVAADEAYLAQVTDDGRVRYAYYPHNVHFLLTSAQMLGDPRTVITQAARLEAILDVQTGRELPWVQAIYAAPYFAMAQYNAPAATLALTSEPHELDYVNAMRHYARATAYAQQRDVAAFEREVAAMLALQDSEGAQFLDANAFPAPLIIRLAAEVARGRLAMAQGRPEDAVPHFASAADMQLQIPYDEPPRWYYPVNQSLGAAYYRAGRYQEAQRAFREALLQAPNSALALYGLARTERALGNRAEAQAAELALSRGWRGEDDWLAMDRI